MLWGCTCGKDQCAQDCCCPHSAILLHHCCCVRAPRAHQRRYGHGAFSGAWPEEQQQQEVAWSSKEKATQKCLQVVDVDVFALHRGLRHATGEHGQLWSQSDTASSVPAARPKYPWPHSFPASPCPARIKPPSPG